MGFSGVEGGGSLVPVRHAMEGSFGRRYGATGVAGSDAHVDAGIRDAGGAEGSRGGMLSRFD